MAKRSVAVRIAGQEYRIRSDADEAWLQTVASCVDETMAQIRERTGMVDTLDVAVLTCLNLAREVLAARESRRTGGAAQTMSRDRLWSLIERAEAACRPADEKLPEAGNPDETPAAERDLPQLLTLPQRDQPEAGNVLGPIVRPREKTGKGADSRGPAGSAATQPAGATGTRGKRA